MDRSVDAKMWRRGFSAGFLALALSVGGQVTLGGPSSREARCPLGAQESLAEQLVQRLKPAVRSHGGVAQRVALAVLGAMLHNRCS